MNLPTQEESNKNYIETTHKKRQRNGETNTQGQQSNLWTQPWILEPGSYFAKKGEGCGCQHAFTVGGYRQQV